MDTAPLKQLLRRVCGAAGISEVQVQVGAAALPHLPKAHRLTLRPQVLGHPVPLPAMLIEQSSAPETQLPTVVLLECCSSEDCFMQSSAGLTGTAVARRILLSVAPATFTVIAGEQPGTNGPCRLVLLQTTESQMRSPTSTAQLLAQQARSLQLLFLGEWQPT